MKIGFDARMIRHTGIGTYIRSLLEELLAAGRQHSFLLFGPRDFLQDLEFRHQNARIVHSTLPIYSVSEQLFHPALRARLTVYHVPHYNIPIFYRGKMVVTLHDVNHVEHPEFLPNRMAFHYAKFMIRKAYVKSSSMICVSNSCLNQFKSFYQISADRCRVVHEAVRPEYLIRWREEEKTKVRIRYRLPEKYVLSVGMLKPHKNVLTLLQVFRSLRKEHLLDQQLVIVGKSFDRHPEILVELHKGIREGYIRHLEDVPREDLPGIYQMASLFSFLSLYEGFGLPLLEAFASGVPVIASNVSSIPEVAGGGALLVNPTNREEIKQAFLALLGNESLRKDWAGKGLRQIERFSWKKAADETLQIYESICEEKMGAPRQKVHEMSGGETAR
ncbi:MAG: glycosyltransferase family 4 protein [Candidatus Omnitrophica bacterium]|nr:glycosyltransferase family 4 protein [Candidatus Omnitrophota bacterium]